MLSRKTKLIPAAGVLAVAAVAVAAGPKGIVIDTDRSVNCATAESIVADVTRGCKTDQEKAVAIYNFVVRTVWMPYVFGHPKEMFGRHLRSIREPLKIINVYGAIGCGSQAEIFCTLLHAAGIESRLLAPGFAHMSSEAKWGGKWHWMDVWLPLYLTDDKGEIYSYEELMADRSLVTKAIQDGRVSENFMYNPGPDTGAVVKAKGHRPAGSGVRKCNYVENLCLRPGESCTWLWDHVGKWYWPEEKYSCPAFKFAADANCKQAFPYWEPYKKIIKNGPHPWSDVYYRYYGNAIFVTSPPMTAQGLADLEAKLTDVAFADGGGVRPAKAAPGQVLIRFDLPYVIADTEIEGAAELAGGGSLRLAYSIDGGKTFKDAKEITDSGPFARFSIGKPNSRQYPEGTTSGQYGFLLRATLAAGDDSAKAVLKELKVTNTTMLNFYSRPWLETGENEVTVTCRNAAELAKTPLEVTWRWVEDWHTPRPREKTFTHEVRRNGATCRIGAGGEKRPKMKSVTIACPAR